MAIVYPNSNDPRFDFSSAEIHVAGKVIRGIKEISYSDDLEPGKVHGTYAQAVGRTRGSYNCEASITLFKEESSELIKALGDGFAEKSFDVVVMYAEKGASTVRDVIKGCRIKKTEASGSSGNSDALEVKHDLDPMYILWNGKSALKKLLK